MIKTKYTWVKGYYCGIPIYTTLEEPYIVGRNWFLNLIVCLNIWIDVNIPNLRNEGFKLLIPVNTDLAPEQWAINYENKLRKLQGEDF